MPDDRLDALAHLFEEGEALLRDGRSAAQVAAAPGLDATGAVRVTLDAQGRVAAVIVVAGWRRLGVEALPDAVVEAIRDASVRLLDGWGQEYGKDAPGRSVATADSSTRGRSVAGAVADRVQFDRDDFQRRLQAVATAQMSEADRRVALTELLGLAEAIERGIDEVSGKLHATLTATHVGQSPDRHVTVTMTGGGEVTTVRFDKTWLRDAHEINIGRQTTAAFHAAYEKVDAHGVSRLIADSPLGAVHRATQDPLDLARRLRLSD